MIAAIIGLLAVILEVLAIYFLMPLQEGSPIKLVSFLLVHGVASLCLAAFVTAALPPQLRRPVPPVIMLLFGFSFFIPVLGLLGQVVALLVAKYLPRVIPELPYAEMPAIEFEFPPRELRERTKYSPGERSMCRKRHGKSREAVLIQRSGN